MTLICFFLYLVQPSLLSLTQCDEGREVFHIGRITVSRKEVFNADDSTDANWILKAANQIHALTKEKTIRGRLLFKEGDLFNQDLVDESARLLRGMGIIGDVQILCDTVSNNTINIVVLANDKWTLGINTSYKRDGGITSYSATVKDDNFLGNAQSISLGYNYSSDRRNRHGTEVIFTEPHLFNSWWKLKMQYKSNEHLQIKTILVERPFYSDAATWSVGTYLDAGRNRVRIFNEGTATQEYDTHQENKLLWGTHTSNTWPRLAIGFGYVHTRTTSEVGVLGSADNIDLINLSLSVMNRWYYTTTFVENFGRVEDIPLGFQASMTLGRNFYHSESSSPTWFLRTNWRHAFHPSHDWYLAYDATLSGFFVEGKPKDATLSLSCLQHWRLANRQILALRTSFILGENWSPSAQLTLGSQTGLRGYPAYALSGNRQLLLNIEHRLFSNVEFWIFRFGSVIFYDTGTVWKAEERCGLQKLHSSAGFGLRIENTKQAGSGIIRIDFAFNLDENRFAQIIFSSDHLFRAFHNIDYTPPTELH